MHKAKYLGLIIGTIGGLTLAHSIGTSFSECLPVPLGLIGYALGALFAAEASGK